MDNKNFQIEGAKIQLPVNSENMKEYDITYIIDQRRGFILDCPDHVISITIIIGEIES